MAGLALLAEALPLWDGAHAALEAWMPEAGPDRFRAGLRTLA